MRNAYGGRAAAYEKQGDYARAAADYGMIVFSYAVEIDAGDPKNDAYKDLLKDAAKAYRTRAACLQAKGDRESAGRDLKRAERMDAKAKKASEKDPTAEAPASPLTAQVTLRNDWTDTLTIVIGTASYTLRVGESKTMPTPAGSFAYEMQAGPDRIRGTLNAGQTYSLGVHPPKTP